MKTTEDRSRDEHRNDCQTDHLDERYREIGISAVAAAARYKDKPAVQPFSFAHQTRYFD